MVSKNKKTKMNSESDACCGSSSGKSMLLNIIILILLIFVVVESIYIALGKVGASSGQEEVVKENLLAMVNGHPVYLREVNAIISSVPKELVTNETPMQAFNQVINRKLLLQDAIDNGIEVTESEIDEALNAFLSENGLSFEQLEENLANNSVTLNFYRESLKEDLLIGKMVEMVTEDVQPPTETDLMIYYEAAKEKFMTPMKASVNQLTIYADEENNAEKFEFIKGIAEELKEKDLCDLIKEYSEDEATKDSCGVYDFQEGQLLPEFEKVVFNSEIGSTKLLQSRIGYHIVRVNNIVQAKQLGFDEVKESINNYFVIANKEAALNKHLVSLRETAKIVNYANE